MSAIPPALERVIDEFSRFPGIGRKTAQRLAFFMMDSERNQVEQLAQSLMSLKDDIRECVRCHNFSQVELCEICQDPRRNQRLLCVVEHGMDIMVFERLGEYRGVYHVLGGVISPLDGITADDLHIEDLKQRMPSLDEMIIATNPSIEGDTTALYLLKLSENTSLKITRLARGLPVGGHLEFTDDATLANALAARVEL